MSPPCNGYLVPHPQLVLNAFRHHRNCHGGTSANKTLNIVCSTPFGIIGILTHHQRLEKLERSVLNAFRHSLEFSRDSGVRLIALRAACSTPFGIIGILTLRRDDASDVLFRAQRLSASSEFSQVVGWSQISPSLVCSTPFGVIGILTTSACLAIFEIRLSACSTPFGIIGILTYKELVLLVCTRCAQRLSASSEFSLAAT
jgi:hypothetical protein